MRMYVCDCVGLCVYMQVLCFEWSEVISPSVVIMQAYAMQNNGCDTNT